MTQHQDLTTAAELETWSSTTTLPAWRVTQGDYILMGPDHEPRRQIGRVTKAVTQYCHGIGQTTLICKPPKGTTHNALTWQGSSEHILTINSL